MSQALQIRPGTEADAERILDLHVRAIREVCGRDYTPEQIEAWAGPKLAAHYLEPIRQGTLFVAEQGDRLVGMGDWHGTRNEITAVYVDPDFGRQGIGRALFEVVMNAMKLRGFKDAILDASLTSVGFYETMGWRVVEQRMHTFRPGVAIPCVRMAIEW